MGIAANPGLMVMLGRWLLVIGIAVLATAPIQVACAHEAQHLGEILAAPVFVKDTSVESATTTFGVRAFINDCARTVGDLSATVKALKADRFKAEDGKQGGQWVRADGRASEMTVWQPLIGGAGVEAFTQPDGLVCRVYLGKANVGLAERELSLFSMQTSIMGLSVRRVFKGPKSAAKGSPQVVAYSLENAPPTPGDNLIILVLETNADPDAVPMAALKAYVQTPLSGR